MEPHIKTKTWKLGFRGVIHRDCRRGGWRGVLEVEGFELRGCKAQVAQRFRN